MVAKWGDYEKDSCYLVMGGDDYDAGTVVMGVFHTEHNARKWCESQGDFIWNSKENCYERRDKSWGDFYRIVKESYKDVIVA